MFIIVFSAQPQHSFCLFDLVVWGPSVCVRQTKIERRRNSLSKHVIILEFLAMANRLLLTNSIVNCEHYFGTLFLLDFFPVFVQPITSTENDCHATTYYYQRTSTQHAKCILALVNCHFLRTDPFHLRFTRSLVVAIGFYLKSRRRRKRRYDCLQCQWDLGHTWLAACVLCARITILFVPSSAYYNRIRHHHLTYHTLHSSHMEVV